VFPENVGLMRRLSSHLNGRRATEPDSDETLGFSARKSCSTKRMAISDELSSVRGRSDVAIGNVIGSNLFNILVILGISATIAPLHVQPTIYASDCWWMLGVTLLLFPIMFTGLRVNRWEGGLLLAAYCLYLGNVLFQVP
jgi:cation:H+ antiporter